MEDKQIDNKVDNNIEKKDIKSKDKPETKSSDLEVSFKKIESQLKPLMDEDNNNPDNKKEEKPYQLNDSILPSTIDFIFKIIAKVRKREDIIPMLLLTESDKQLVNDGMKPLIERLLEKYHILAWQFEAILMVVAIFMPRIIIIIDNPPPNSGNKNNKDGGIKNG